MYISKQALNIPLEMHGFPKGIVFFSKDLNRFFKIGYLGITDINS